MNAAQKIAASLNGSEYPFDVPPAIAQQANDNGIVIVCGASDDLIEFYGAFRDEAVAYKEMTVLIDKDGIIPTFEQFRDDDDNEEEDFQRYFARRQSSVEIVARWAPDDDGISWKYETDIPHSKFHVMEYGDVYCIGIVFSLADIGASA